MALRQPPALPANRRRQKGTAGVEAVGEHTELLRTPRSFSPVASGSKTGLSLAPPSPPAGVWNARPPLQPGRLGPAPVYDGAASRAGCRLRQTAPARMLHGGAHFTNDGKYFLHGGHDDHEVSLWDLEDATRVIAVEQAKAVDGLAVSVDGETVCITTSDGIAAYRITFSTDNVGSTTLLWETGSGTAHVAPIFSRDGKLIASICRDWGIAEVRDVASSDVVFSLTGFEACVDSPFALGFSDATFAIGGRSGTPNARQVRLLGPEFQLVKTLELEGIFCSLAFCERGEKLAIGTTRHLAVLLLSRSDGWCSSVKLQVPYLTDDRLHTVVNSISFNNSGSQLCCGYYPSMIFALFDVQTTACVKVLKRPGTRGKACAFSPADDRLATGGENEPFVFHDILPIPLLAKYRTSVARVTAAATSEHSVIMSAGSRLMGVRRSDGKSLFQLDLGTNVAAAFYPLALRPDGAQAACCMWETDSVAVIDVVTGSELRRLGPFAGWFGGVKYSPDGKALLVFGHWGTIMFDTESGAETHSFVDIEGANIHSCDVDASGKFLVTTGKPNGTAFVKDLNSGANVHTLESGVGHGSGGVSFDDAGMRMAYFVMGGASGKRISRELDVERNGCVIVCDVTDGFRELLRIHLPDLGWAPHLQFSPGDGKYILLTSYVRNGTIMVLDSATGQEPAWSKCLRSLMLPAGVLNYRTVKWVFRSRQSSSRDVFLGTRACAQERIASTRHMLQAAAAASQTAAVDNTRKRRSQRYSSTDLRRQASAVQDFRDSRRTQITSLIMQAAIDGNLCLIDVTAYIRSFQEDGNFSMAQLNCLSDHSPEAIPALVENWPHVINFRDPVSGDTVLHYCTQAHHGVTAAETIAARSKAAKLWLASTYRSCYKLLPNNQNRTALSNAISTQNPDMLRLLITSLDPAFPLSNSQWLVDALADIAAKLPLNLVGCIELLQDPKCYNVFRTRRTVPFLKRRLEDFDTRGSTDGLGLADWEEYEPLQQVQSMTQMFKAVDADASGKISFTEFKVWWSARQVGSLRAIDEETVDAIRQLWDEADTDGSGELDEHEFARVLEKMAASNKPVQTMVIRGDVHHLIRCETAIEVMALRGFAGAPSNERPVSPYTALLKAGNRLPVEDFNALLRTKLMIVCTAFKWKAYGRHWVLQRVALHLIHLVLVAVALVLSTQSQKFQRKRSSTRTLDDCLVVAVLVTNSCLLLQALKLLGLFVENQHVIGGWDVLDVVGIVAVYTACVAHFSESQFMLEQVGAIGMLFNTLAFLKMLQPFSATGTLIKLLLEVIESREIFGFLSVMLVLISGFSVAFAVSMPANEAFYSPNDSHYVLAGLLTTTMAMAGNFNVGDYNYVALAMFLFFWCLVFVVMFNVLIATVVHQYERVIATAEVEVRKLRAQAIIDAEARMSVAEKCNLASFPEFIEVMVPIADHELDQADEKIAPVQEQIVRLQERIVGAEANWQRAEEKRERMEILMNEKISRVASDMTQMKDLLEQLVRRDS